MCIRDSRQQSMSMALPWWEAMRRPINMLWTAFKLEVSIYSLWSAPSKWEVLLHDRQKPRFACSPNSGQLELVNYFYVPQKLYSDQFKDWGVNHKELQKLGQFWRTCDTCGAAIISGNVVATIVRPNFSSFRMPGYFSYSTTDISSALFVSNGSIE